MMNDFKINIPDSLRDITLGQWQEYIDIYDKNKDDDSSDFLDRKMLEIFCGVNLQHIDLLGLNVYEDAINHVSNILNSKADLVSTFDLKGTDGVIAHFGMIPNLDKMSYGEFIDLEKYIFVEKDMHKAMAVMYRPIKFQSKEKYLIHDYKGTEYLAEVMKSTPLDVAFGVRVFFYRLATKLGTYTMVSTLKDLQTKQEGRVDEHSVKSGESIKQYIHSLEKMSEELEKLQDSQYTNV